MGTAAEHLTAGTVLRRHKSTADPLLKPLLDWTQGLAGFWVGQPHTAIPDVLGEVDVLASTSALTLGAQG